MSHVNRSKILTIIGLLVTAHLIFALVFATLPGVLPSARTEVFIAFLFPPIWRETGNGWFLSVLAIACASFASVTAILRPGRVVLLLATLALVANSCISCLVHGAAI